MKILQITDMRYPRTINGVSVYINSLVKELKKTKTFTIIFAQRTGIKTSKKVEFIDITGLVEQYVEGTDSGLIHIFCPHTTAGLTINENADPDVVRDIIAGLERMVPERGGYRHAEGNSPAHIKASLMGFHLFVPVRDGRLVLGTWQGIYFCEFDGPRSRRVVVTSAA